jgi:signal transduction histidine kinase
MRVLVVDDDPIYRETARMFLSMHGRKVTVAENGRSGLATLRQQSFDLLIVDMEMPDITGLEVISTVRSDPAFQDLPIIMVTSRDDAMAIDRSYELGASSFVVKPVNWTLMDHQIRFVTRAVRNETIARQAQGEAEMLSQMKDHLLNILRHEMRTPLNAILGFTHLASVARDSGDLEGMRHHLAAVEESGQRLINSFADMASYSDLISRRIQPSLEPTRAAWLIDDVIEAEGTQLKSQGIAVHRQDLSGDAVMQCDPALLGIALRHLVENVLRHADGKTLSLSAHVAGDFISLTIADDGRGMAPDEVKRALEPFTQINMSLSRPQQGLGLGLPIAAETVSLQGGTLKIQSEPGQGTRVILSLKRVQA